MKRILFYSLVLLILTGTVLPVYSQASTRYALVIGNANYQRIDKLRNTVADAEDIATALGRLGYQVDLKRNLSNLQMVEAVDNFVSRLSSNRNSEGFIWYAGHAVQIRDENYLLPIDVTTTSESLIRASSYSLNNLLDSLSGAKNKVNVIILDSCRDNPLPASSGTRSAGTSRGLSVPNVQNHTDLFVMFSTAPGEKAEDGPPGTRNSPFAQAFLKHINNAEPLTIMAADVANETLSLTGGKQRPFTTGSIISEKYYSLNQTAPQTVAAAQPAAAAVHQTPAPAPTPAPAAAAIPSALPSGNRLAGVIDYNMTAGFGQSEIIINAESADTNLAVWVNGVIVAHLFPKTNGKIIVNNGQFLLEVAPTTERGGSWNIGTKRSVNVNANSSRIFIDLTLRYGSLVGLKVGNTTGL